MLNSVGICALPLYVEGTMLASLVDAPAHGAVVEHRPVLDVADSALLIDEEGLRELQDGIAPGDHTVGVEKWREAIERERVHETAHLRAVLEQIDREERRVAVARDALHGRHLLAAGLAPGRPERHHDDL